MYFFSFMATNFTGARVARCNRLWNMGRRRTEINVSGREKVEGFCRDAKEWCAISNVTHTHAASRPSQSSQSVRQSAMFTSHAPFSRSASHPTVFTGLPTLHVYHSFHSNQLNSYHQSALAGHPYSGSCSQPVLLTQVLCVFPVLWWGRAGPQPPGTISTCQLQLTSPPDSLPTLGYTLLSSHVIIHPEFPLHPNLFRRPVHISPFSHSSPFSFSFSSSSCFSS